MNRGLSGRYTMSEHDVIKNPSWYTRHPSGVEPLSIAVWESFCIGNCLKYIFRASAALRKTDKKDGDKDPYSITDLEKARRYLDEEILHRRKLEKIDRDAKQGRA
jgi:hypothetical protein|tara:strand:- start:1881 stop:2195 length:315 start_codon:yes stop_codon:yes gene_type:complete